MQVTVKLFATLRMKAGWAEQKFDLPTDATITTLLATLEEKQPDLDMANRPVYAAVNQDYADAEQQLVDGDIVALFPPVSGG